MKTLNDVINAVQHETQLSRSQLSLRIGKSRNYLNTTVKNGLSYDKEQEVIALLLDLIDDEVTMLHNQIDKKNEEIDRVLGLNEWLRVVIKERVDEIATKNLFIDGLDMENKGLMDRISKLEKTITSLKKSNEILGNDIQLKAKTIESLAKAGHSTGKQLNKEITKNRALTASIIGLVAIFSVYLWVK